MIEREREVFDEAIRYFGVASQKGMMHEEIGELLQELGKLLQGMNKVQRGDYDIKHLAEEIADVEITLDQVKMIYGIEDTVGFMRTEKVNRIKKRMSAEVKA